MEALGQLGVGGALRTVLGGAQSLGPRAGEAHRGVLVYLRDDFASRGDRVNLTNHNILSWLCGIGVVS